MFMTQNQALEILKTGANVFLTGEPGSGKTHTINEYVAYLRQHDIEAAVTASTGIAATHIGGMTIHSWAGIGIKNSLDKYELDRIASNKYVFERVDKANILIIDEISMLAPNTLSMVDAVCREIKRVPLPFGGLQVILVGDFFQLPPVFRAEEKDGSQELIPEVQKRFAYESPAWAQANPIVCYLTEQHRQEDSVFLEILSAIRKNSFSPEHLGHLKRRKVEVHEEFSDIPKLFSHNQDVDRLNTHSLNQLPEQVKVFVMGSKGRPTIVEALKKNCLSPERLELKLHASVMFTKNNARAGYVNGTLGVVTKFDENTGNPVVKTRDGNIVRVEPADWSIEDNGNLLAKITQLPLRLAWAITVHKSQGMSLDAAVMDLGQVFEFGQGYVALSRVRSLAGLHLINWNDRAFQVHPQILAIDAEFRVSSEAAKLSFGKMDPQEQRKMRENFIQACGGSVETVKETKKRERTVKQKGQTYMETLALWKAGKLVPDIAKERNLTVNTILGHLERLYFDDHINDADIQKIIPPNLAKAIDSIHKAFRELGSEHLSVVFEKFEGKYSYEDLRMARMVFKE